MFMKWGGEMGIEQALRDCNDNRVILSGQLSALRRQNDELRQQNVAMAAQLRAIPRMTIVAPDDGRIDWMLGQALEALFANAGDDAIGMLEDADYCVTHPVIAAAIAEWREMA